MERGLGSVGLLLAVSLLVTIPAGVSGASTHCPASVGQDDAESGRDAGDQRWGAVELTEERRYPAAIGYPTAVPADLDDWYRVSWADPTPRRVMVDVRTWRPPTAYGFVDGLAESHLELAAYAPGDSTPTHTATGDVGQAPSLAFDTAEPGTWHFRVSVRDAPQTGVCSPADTAASDQRASENYGFYIGCHPHCLTVNTQ